MPTINRESLAAIIAQHLTDNKDALHKQWMASTPVRHFYLDDLLPKSLAKSIFDSLPAPQELMLRDSIKERKRVGIKIENYAPEMEAILFAFQDDAVLEIVSEITGRADLHADASLYGSGISQMTEGDFLLPHLDNSHDGDGALYRVLNALYYITPNWPEHSGGNLELWDKNMKQRVEIHARFNRLVMMETHTESVHSVSKIIQPGGVRACISNYYFSAIPADGKEHMHKTIFFARPEDGAVKKMRLGMEGAVKKSLSRLLPNNKSGTKHRRP